MECHSRPSGPLWTLYIMLYQNYFTLYKITHVINQLYPAFDISKIIKINNQYFRLLSR